MGRLVDPLPIHPVGGRKWFPPPTPSLRVAWARILVIRAWLPRVGPLSICGIAGGPGQARACGARGPGGGKPENNRETDRQARTKATGQTRARARDQQLTEFRGRGGGGGGEGAGGRGGRAGRLGRRRARSCCGGRRRAGRRVSAPGPARGALPFSELSQPEFARDPRGIPGGPGLP